MGNGCDRPVHADHKYCIFHLPHKTDEDSQEFEKALASEIDKQLKQHSDRLDLQGFQFAKPVDLKEMLPFNEIDGRWTIAQMVNLADSCFFDTLNGMDITFPGRLNAAFARATFQGEVWFSGATFEGCADFADAVFHKATRFVDTKFQGSARFVGTRFKGEAVFWGAIFQGAAVFSSSSFLGLTVFDHASFEAITDFNLTEFNGQTTFHEVKFKQATSFLGACFGRLVTFSDSSFFAVTKFDRSKFQGAALFDHVAFFEDLQITPAAQQQGASTVSLHRIKLAGGAELDMSEFLGSKNAISTLLILRNWAFDGHAKITLRGAMGCVSLLEMDLSKIVFMNEDWHPRADVIGPSRYKRRRAALEEYELEKMTKGIERHAEPLERMVRRETLLSGVNADSVAQLYRRLRDNYELSKRYAEAGDFFIGEMEILRQYKTLQMKPESPDSPRADLRRAAKRSRLDPYRLFLLEPYRILAL
jgi:uncharacterized protein YjbI with pentapeptide repeats